MKSKEAKELFNIGSKPISVMHNNLYINYVVEMLINTMNNRRRG